MAKTNSKRGRSKRSGNGTLAREAQPTPQEPKPSYDRVGKVIAIASAVGAAAGGIGHLLSGVVTFADWLHWWP